MSAKLSKTTTHSKPKMLCCFGSYFSYLWQYRNTFKMMVKRDFQGKFKNTILGYFWHLLNPLSQILMYLVIFTVIFGRDVPNYWVYLSTGMFAFSFFSNCARSGCSIIIRNSNTVTKMTFPRELFTLVDVTSGLITLVISYVLLTALMLIAGVSLSLNILYIPVIVLMLAIFTAGISYALSALTVYVRDLSSAVGIILTCLMFSVPIFYMASGFSNSGLEVIWLYNPLYYFVEAIHASFYYGAPVPLSWICICLFVSLIVFIVGFVVFKKLEPGFAERL